MARAVDADDLIKVFQHKLENNIFPLCVISTIEEAPTIEADHVKHGKWMGWGKGGTYHYENYGTCSVCHEDAEIGTKHRNYCPNCGARMDGE